MTITWKSLLVLLVVLSGCAALTRHTLTEEIQRIILAEGTAIDIAAQAQRDGVRDLRQSGLVKVRSGATTLEEIIAATNE